MGFSSHTGGKDGEYIVVGSVDISKFATQDSVFFGTEQLNRAQKYYGSWSLL